MISRKIHLCSSSDSYKHVGYVLPSVESSVEIGITNTGRSTFLKLVYKHHADGNLQYRSLFTLYRNNTKMMAVRTSEVWITSIKLFQLFAV